MATSAEQLLAEARINPALEELQRTIRANPSVARHRIFLFQLQAIRGEWEKALTQLNVAAELDPIALGMAQMYREALRNEALRAEVFAGKRSPLVLGEPPEWIGLLIEAVRLLAQGQDQAAADLRGRAFDAAPASPGMLDGQPFEWIADADPRLGPVLEVIVNGRYFWVPFTNIREIRIEPPADLRDFVWAPAYFTWVNGGEAVGVIPTRYPASESNPDDLIRLARKTEWIDRGHDLFVGQGQRLLATDAGEHALLDIRTITLHQTTHA